MKTRNSSMAIGTQILERHYREKHKLPIIKDSQLSENLTDYG